MKKEFRETVNVEVRIYNACKYEVSSATKYRVKYKINAYEVKEIAKDEIIKESDESNVDEYNEYLILYLNDGDTATFRNSHVDMYLIN